MGDIYAGILPVSQEVSEMDYHPSLIARYDRFLWLDVFHIRVTCLEEGAD